MSDFRQHFLDESIKNLSILHSRCRADGAQNLRPEAFRVIHSVKGGAQTLDLSNAARLATELEDLLADGKNSADNKLLLEGINLLINSLREITTDSASDFIEKLQSINQTRTTKSDILLITISPKIFKVFSRTEQNAAISAMLEGKNILCAEIGFQPDNFADEYRNLRKSLSEKGEIIASLPSEKFKASREIGFQIFLASRENAADLEKFLENYPLEISSHTCDDRRSSEIFKMLSQIAAHGEKIAGNADKEINFTILANDLKLSAERVKIVFDILLHLVRNAVSHAIAQNGRVEIRLFADDDDIYLSVADNGRGVDLESVRARAVARNLISETDELSPQQILELIFASELSTAERVTEISGRGVGLDAVKTAVENLHGKIFVKSRKTNGTIFEIFLPKERL